MNDWQSTYLGRGALPRDLSGFEIEAFFTYSEPERRLIDDERRTPALKLALALQIVPVGEPGDGLEYDEDAVGARPLERPTFHRCAAGADRAHRPDAHRGYQLAGRVHLPDRAIPGPAVTVTSGSKITRLWRLNGSSNPLKGLLSQSTERPLSSAGYRCARHFCPCFCGSSTGTFGTEIKGTPMNPPDGFIEVFKCHFQVRTQLV